MTGSIQVKIEDGILGEALPFVVVVLLENGDQKAQGNTNFSGQVTFNDLPFGEYQIKAQFTGYQPKTISGIEVADNKLVYVECSLDSTDIKLEPD